MATTSIEWTDTTWNPTTGCDRVSDGCDNCYALVLAKRLKGMGSAKYQTDGDPKTSGPGFGLAVHEDTLADPFGWKKPRKVFVNSMSDLFHDKVPDRFIGEVFSTMGATSHHTFQILTKRHARMRSLLRRWSDHLTVGCHCPSDQDGCSAPVDVLYGVWPLPNVWLGVSVEDQKRANLRIPALLETPATMRFLSCEPLLGPVDLALTAPEQPYWHDRIDWVIAGGESGPGARPMHPNWARSLRDQCEDTGVSFHFKQRGAFTWEVAGGGDWPEPNLYVNDVTGEALPEAEVPATGSWAGVWRVGKKRAGRELDGRTWDEFPAEIT